jgi:hypothetical protein
MDTIIYSKNLKNAHRGIWLWLSQDIGAHDDPGFWLGRCECSSLPQMGFFKVLNERT